MQLHNKVWKQSENKKYGMYNQCTWQCFILAYLYMDEWSHAHTQSQYKICYSIQAAIVLLYGILIIMVTVTAALLIAYYTVVCIQYVCIYNFLWLSI